MLGQSLVVLNVAVGGVRPKLLVATKNVAGQLVQRLEMVLQLEVGRRLGIAQVTNQQIHGFHRFL